MIGLAFAADLAIGIPFDGARPMMDVGALLAAGVLGYLAWDALRDAR
jgi:hypothetical protein